MKMILVDELIEKESVLGDFVKQELSLKSDESKRLESKKETISMNGSFKKLVIDWRKFLTMDPESIIIHDLYLLNHNLY